MTNRPIMRDLTDVEVTFIDGEIKTYRITAGQGISRYLAKCAANTGILTLYNNETSHGIPLAQIREYQLLPVYADQEENDA